MEKKSLKVLIWGFGHMNKLVLRYLYEKGHILVGVIGHHNIGEDSGVIAGLKENGIRIEEEQKGEELIKKVRPDACILATRSTINDLYSNLLTLGNNGVNTITIGEEAFYSWNTSPKKTREIDQAFKKNNCTFTATGMQDVFWGYLPVTLIGSSHRVDRIEGTIRYNVDDYGRALCEAHGVGLNEEEFKRRIIQNALPTYVWNSNEWLCSKMNWKIKKTTQNIYPIFENELEVPSKSLGQSIQKGKSLGLKAIVKTETENKITIETTMIGQVYYGSEMYDLCAWKLFGEPNTELVVKNPATVEITCASAVNRLSQLIQSRKGYVTTDLLDMIK